MKLQNKTALVTGAGSGIGRATARRFVEEGAEIFLNDVSRSRAEETSLELGLNSRRVLVADVSSSAQVSAMFEAFDRLDILVNNAGVADTTDRWRELNRKAEARLEESPITTHWDVTMEMDDTTWRRMISVHLDGTFYCTREALKKMSARNPPKGCSIINLSSTAAIGGLPDAPHYAAAKAGILGFTRSVAREVGSRGIRVNAIAPGFIDTPMSRNISEPIRKISERAIPLGRWGSPDEIAALALFLASDEASYITGQCISANGGLL
jgi:3-oxoacyl-[acyl-carrier protein] reductase